LKDQALGVSDISVAFDWTRRRIADRLEQAASMASGALEHARGVLPLSLTGAHVVEMWRQQLQRLAQDLDDPYGTA
jgi:hypothetical protein